MYVVWTIIAVIVMAFVLSCMVGGTFWLVRSLRTPRRTTPLPPDRGFPKPSRAPYR